MTVYLVYVDSTEFELFYNGDLLRVFDSEEKARQYIEENYEKCIYNAVENVWEYKRAYDTLRYRIEEWEVN